MFDNKEYQKLLSLQGKVYLLKERKKSLEIQKVQLEAELKSIGKFIEEIIRPSMELYRKVIDIMNEYSVVYIEQYIESVLGYIFNDMDMRFKIKMEDYRGVKKIDFYISHNSDFLSLKNSVGNGVRSVISFFLQAFLLMKMKSPYLFVDEKYSGLSDEYLQRFMEVVGSFCKKYGFIFVLITHDQRFIPYANKSYFVVNGNVREVK